MKADRSALQPGAPAAWAALLDGLPDAAWLVELAALRVVAANAARPALFGRAGADAARRAGAARWPVRPRTWPTGRLPPPAMPARLQSDTVVAAGRRPRAARQPQHPAAAAPQTAGAAPTHALVVLADRSAERRAESERELLLAELQSTLEATADGILVTDLDGRVRAFNRRFAEMWAMPLVAAAGARRCRRAGLDGAQRGRRPRPTNTACTRCARRRW